MPVPTLISQLSTTASLNSPDGAVDVPSSIDDYQRAHAAFIAQLYAGTVAAPTVIVPSATTTDIGAAASENVDISGNTTITGFGTVAEGINRKGRFTGVLTLTHNATSLILPGNANITTANNDRYEAQSLGGGNWIVTKYVYANGSVISAMLAAYATNAPLSFRNKIINGDMRIDQRNAGAAVTPTAGTYLVDRFAAGPSQASKLTFQQVADAPTGFKFSTKITVASQFAPAAGDFFDYSQRIEGQNIIDLAFGTASAAAITVSFYAKTSVAGTYSASLANNGGTRTYVFSVALTTSWAKYTVTIPGETTGTWATDNTVGLRLRFNLGTGTNYQTASPNTWLAGNYLAATGSTQFVNQTAGATLNITGVQLEAGTVATSFENRPIGTEFALCQRYYQFSGTIGLACQNSTTSAVTYYQDFIYPVFPRIVPTITLGTPSYSGASALAVNTAGAAKYRLSASINASTPMGTAEAQVFVSAEL